ncbi:MAG: HEAT repeat domain-containing protein [Acidobacteria bacterium]|nr:HEAT repeat domain-containing protein [Acidobacteriota bacterium]
MWDLLAPRRRLELLDALASRDPAQSGPAEEALAANGRESVPLLISCLDEPDDGLRFRAMSLLSLIADPRAARPLASLLHDPCPLTRQRAATALASIPGAETVSSLNRLLKRESNASVRLAAMRSLVRQVQIGHQHALTAVLDRLNDENDDPRVRVIALEAIPWALSRGAVQQAARAMVERLAADGPEPVARKARRLLDTGEAPRFEASAVSRLLDELGNSRLTTWKRAVSVLAFGGPPIVDSLVQAMLARPADQEYANRAALVLNRLPPRCRMRIGNYLDQVREPIVLEALVEVVGGRTDMQPLQARLAALIDQLAQRAEAEGPGPLDRVRQLAHLALAVAGSRLAAADLRRLLEDRRIAVRPALALAAARVGTRQELPALVRAYRRSRGEARLAIREAVQRVAEREKIRRTDRTLLRLDPAERRAAMEILGESAPARHKQLPRRMGRASSPILA